MDAVILCGGEGTRIRHLLPEGTPKIMADINGTPFVDILIQHILLSGFERLIFVGGYGCALLSNHLEKYRDNPNLPSTAKRILLYWQREPNGTAGAIEFVKGNLSEDFFVFNGDTFCDVNYKAMFAYHEATNSTITVACDNQFRHVGTFIASQRFIDFIKPLDSGLCKNCRHGWEKHDIDGEFERECLACGDCYDYEFDPKSKVDMAEVFALLGQQHEPVGWFMTDAKYWDIGTPENLEAFRNYWAQLPKGGEGRMIGSDKDAL